MTVDVIEDFLQRLEATGWTAGWTPAAISALRERVTMGHRRHPEHLYLSLATGGYDSECIEDDESYPSVVEAYAEASGGVFNPVDVESEILDEDTKVRVSFRLKGKSFRTVLPFDGDYVDSKFEAFLNRSLKSVGEKVAFFSLPPVDQTLSVVCVAPAAYRKAEAAGLIPRQDVPKTNKKKEKELKAAGQAVVDAADSADLNAIMDSMREFMKQIGGNTSEAYLRVYATNVLRERKAKSEGGGARGGA